MSDNKSVWGTIASALPIVGNIFSSLQQRKWAKKDLAEQNKYNSPAEQLARLKAAGLPAAAFFGGGVSSQSDQPRSTQIDQTLGTAPLIEKFSMNAIQKKQLQILDAEIMEKEALAKLHAAEANWWTGQGTSSASPTGTPPQPRYAMRAQGQLNTQGLDIRKNKVVTEIAEKFNYDITEQALISGKLDNDLKEILKGDQKLFLQFKRDLLGKLKAGTKMTAREIMIDLLGLYLARVNK